MLYLNGIDCLDFGGGVPERIAVTRLIGRTWRWVEQSLCSLVWAFILEEGLPIDVLRQVVESIRVAAAVAGVVVVTGDTKVVEKGSGDGL